MNVLLIADKSIIGGATVALINLVDELTNVHQCNVTVITVQNNDLNIRLDEMGVTNIADYHCEAMQEIRGGRMPKWVRFTKAFITLTLSCRKSIHIIEKAVDIESMDIIHTNSARTDIGCYLAKKYHKPHVMHIREFGTLDYECKFIHPKYISFLNKTVDQFISVSEAVRTHWISLGLDDRKIQTIYDGVNSSEFDDEPKREQSPVLRLVCCGTVRKSKGQYQIIESLSYLPDEVKNHITLSLYGWVTEKNMNELNQLAADLNVDRCVRICGVSKNIPTILKEHDVGITASTAEGFGLTTNEYMLSKLGVIVSNTGANPELITDGVTGLIYQYGNSRDLANKIQRFYFDRQLLSYCRENAALYAQENFTSKINAERIIKKYNEVIKFKGCAQ